MKPEVRGLPRPAFLAGATGLVLATVVMAGLPIGAAGQAASDPSLTGTSHPDDLVLARQLLMDSNETEMMTVLPANPPAKPDLNAMKQAAYQIYTNLSAAPHLFPSSTKPVYDKDGNATPSTAASPKIWDNFEAFYNQMTDAANLAYDMSQVADLATFQKDATTLRMDCDTCHGKNMNVFDPTKSP